MKRELINSDWYFTKEAESETPEAVSGKAEKVSLPHCFNAADGQNGEGMYRGYCLYQKSVSFNRKDLEKNWYLEIGAASLVSRIFINGKLAAENQCGFSMYRVHLNPYIREGNNLIAISVDNRVNDTVYPIGADFSFYGGIYRDVYLICTGRVHLDFLDGSRDGVYIDYEKTGKDFRLRVRGRIVREGIEQTDPETVTVECCLKDRSGESVWEKCEQICIEVKNDFQISGTVSAPHLWQGTEDPYLYRLYVRVLGQGCQDERVIEVGFRTIEITPDKGLFLNGKAIKLQGVSRHQDFAGAGNALHEEEMELDMEIIKEMGANSIRLAHYQHHDYFYTLCDRAGMLVWAEIPFISRPSKTDKTNRNAKEQLDKLIRQAYNHCSVFCWGIQNEITLTGETQEIYDLVKELAEEARKLDAYRYIAQANEHNVETDSGLHELTDLAGYNLYYGWYYGKVQDLGSYLDHFHNERKSIPLLVTEYGVDANPAYHSSEPEVKDYTEEYQLMFHNSVLNTFKMRPWLLGGYVWAMFDFGSSIRNEGGKKGINQKGLVTIDRKIKKDAYYLYKAYWSRNPFIKIAGSRYTDRHRKDDTIMILTNLSDVRLYVNEKLQNISEADERLIVFKGIKLKEGKNIVRAAASDRNGQEYEDQIILNGVTEPNQTYICPQKSSGTNVVNWYEKYDLSAAPDIVVKEGCYSVYDTIEVLYHNCRAKKIFEKYFAEAIKLPYFENMKSMFTVERLAKKSMFQMPVEMLGIINNELNTIHKEIN